MWWRWRGGDDVVEMAWDCGGDGVVEMMWWRWRGENGVRIVVEMMWWRLWQIQCGGDDVVEIVMEMNWRR